MSILINYCICADEFRSFKIDWIALLNIFCCYEYKRSLGTKENYLG